VARKVSVFLGKELQGGESVALRVLGGSLGTLLIEGALPAEGGETFKTLPGLTDQDQTLWISEPWPPLGMRLR